MKAKILFILMLLAVSFEGFSITLEPDETKSIDNFELNPVRGAGNKTSLSVRLNWDKKNNLITVTFKNNSGGYFYFFDIGATFSKIKELQKNVWFGKEIGKEVSRVEKYLNDDDLINVTPTETLNSIECLDYNSSQTFQFRLKSPEKNSCKIAMKVYVASNKKKFFLFKRNEKIEYMSNITLDITLSTPPPQVDCLKLENGLVLSTDKVKKSTIEVEKDYQKLINSPCESKKKKFKEKKNEQYNIYIVKDNNEYSICKNAKSIIDSYNAEVNSYNNTILKYNTYLDKPCPPSPLVDPPRRSVVVEPTEPPCDCNSLKSAQDSLGSFFRKFSIEKIGKSQLRDKFNEVKKDFPEKKCKEDCEDTYKGYIRVHNEIKKILEGK